MDKSGKDYKGSDGSAATDSYSTDATARKWTLDGSGTSSAKKYTMNEANVAEERQWEIDGSGTESAKTYDENEANVAEDRLWEIDSDETNPEGNGDSSAKKSEGSTESTIRQWEFDGDKESGKGTRSAKVLDETTAESRKWAFDGSGTTSATVSESTKAEVRLWPEKKSARSITEYLAQHK
jgi:hypothetical protein